MKTFTILIFLTLTGLQNLQGQEKILPPEDLKVYPSKFQGKEQNLLPDDLKVYPSMFLLAEEQNQPPEDLQVYPFKFLKVDKCEYRPGINGTIAPGEWTGPEHGNFVITNGKIGQDAQYQTMFSICRDDKFLYLAIDCHDPEPQNLISQALQFDDERIFYDDRIELFFDVNHDHRTYYHLIMNPAGIQYDRKVHHWLPGTRTYHGYPEWNGFWYGATKVHSSGWTAEIAIDLASLGIQNLEEGSTWGFNLGRVRQPAEKPGDNMRNIAPAKGTEYSAWTKVQDAIWETPSNFYESMTFGDMVFGETGFEIDNISFPNLSYGQGPRERSTVFGNNPFIIGFSSNEHSQLRVEVNVYKPGDGIIFTESSGKIKSSSEILTKNLVNNSLNINYFIQNEQENLVEVILHDPRSGKRLYHTSYMVNAPPFIEFDLETLYTSLPGFNKPVGYRLRTDNINLPDFYLKMSFQNKDKVVIENIQINDLSLSSDYKSIFNTEKLRALPGDNYSIDCQLYSRNDHSLVGHFIQPLTKFTAFESKGFSAYEGDYSFGGITGDAVIINFPFNASFVFWSKASWIPWWDMDQAVMSNEFVEAWGLGAEGCAEPMQDRENRYGSVSILENTPARIKVKWRYALGDAHYYIHANEWVEELYTFYPDGTGVREINVFANTNKDHELFEAIFVNPPHVSTFQLYDDEIISLKKLSGEQHNIREFDSNPSLYKEFMSGNEHFITEIHFKDRLNPYTFFAIDDKTIPPSEHNIFSIARRMISDDTRRGHWPAARYQVDGFNTAGSDVPGHFSLGNFHIMTNSEVKPNKWFFLTGIKKDDASTDILTAKSWIDPVLPTRISGAFTLKEYDVSQRAYILTSTETGKSLSLSFKGMIYNPAFVFENTSCYEVKNVKINGRVVGKSTYATGKSEGNDLILFIENYSGKGGRIEIELGE